MAKVQLTKAQKAKRRRYRARQLRGAVLLFLALIGVYHIASGIVAGVRTAMGNDEDRESYTALIAPLVSLDPVPFESIDKANPTMLLQSAVWAAVRGEDTSKYARTETDQLLVPVVDVQRYFTRMYGSDVSPTYETFTDGDLTFEYVAESDAYIIPITGQVGSYTPQITDMKQSGSTIVLTVAYMEYESSSLVVDPTSDMDEQKAVKTMEYVLLREGSDYHIYTVQYPAKAEG